MVILSDDKGWLHELRHAVREYLTAERLLLHPRKAEIHRTCRGVELLGYRVFPGRIRLRDENGHRFGRRWRRLAERYAAGTVSMDEVRASANGWIGHAQHADTESLRRDLLGAVAFRRGES